MLLQGRKTHVKAAASLFHLGDWGGFTRDKGQVYVQPAPTASLPSGYERAEIHRLLTPTGVKLWEGDLEVFYTFGPPHFGHMLQAAMPIPMLPHWEEMLWSFGQTAHLIESEDDTVNVRLWSVTVDMDAWLKLMGEAHAYLDAKVA
jgi:hypothetical protein